MRPAGVVINPPLFDDDLSFVQRIENFSPFKHSSRSLPLKLSQ
jgi:hypothetical protein